MSPLQILHLYSTKNVTSFHATWRKPKMLGKASKENVEIIINKVISSWSRYYSSNCNPSVDRARGSQRNVLAVFMKYKNDFYALGNFWILFFLFHYLLSLWISVSSLTGISIGVLDKKYIQVKFSHCSKVFITASDVPTEQIFKKSSRTDECQ